MFHQGTGEEVGRYWEVNVVQEVEALDWERTPWPHPEGKHEHEYPVLGIIKEALCWHSLKAVDILRLRIKGRGGTSLCISRGLERSLQLAGVTSGMEFIPIPAY